MVTEIGNNAIVRSTGVSTSQQTSASQEAKDFKVVVTLQDPPENLRPGLSATAKITTATRKRCADDPDSGPDGALAGRSESSQRREKRSAGRCAIRRRNLIQTARTKKKCRVCSSFAIGKPNFVPVTTGITGTTDIEVLSGLKEGDEIITGSYKVLRTLRPGS